LVAHIFHYHKNNRLKKKEREGSCRIQHKKTGMDRAYHSKIDLRMTVTLQTHHHHPPDPLLLLATTMTRRGPPARSMCCRPDHAPWWQYSRSPCSWYDFGEAEGLGGHLHTEQRQLHLHQAHPARVLARLSAVGLPVQDQTMMRESLHEK
jgi:hypothetical protein